ncbi:uncharacterized protein V6R79_007722 [Siganus canaliculatus]
MRLYLILLLLQLGLNVEVSFAQNDITCTVPVMHQYLSAAQLPAATQRVKVGQKLQFECSNGYMLAGFHRIECLESGRWSLPFPTCAETCSLLTGLPEGVRISQLRRTVIIGERLTFYCENFDHFLHGVGEVQCLAGGKWNHPFPTCGEPSGCTKPPPPLENGNTVESVRPNYRPREKVYYSCQKPYSMTGDEYLECVHNEWRGRVECTGPCVVDSEAMRKNNIVLRYGGRNTEYARHGEQFDFVCAEGTKRNTILTMRPICFLGSVVLPTCE